MPKLAIIGYCQTVALLDAIGTWRKSFNESSQLESRNRAEEWEAINTRGHLLDIETNQEFDAFRGSKYCLLNKESHPIDAETLDRFVCEAVQFDAIVSIINGSELDVAGVLDDFDIAPYDERCKDSPPIDSAYMDRWVQGAVLYVQAGLTYMRGRMPRMKIIHIAPPPPVEKTTKFRRPSLGMKNHIRNVTRMREITASLEIQFLEERPEALTADGFLTPEFDDEGGRGNKALGQLTAHKLLKMLQVD
jgi:hypothetical protein